MTDSPFDDLGGKRERYQDILARSLVGRKEPPLTEAELAAREIEARDKMRRHDQHFRTDFISPVEQQLVSRTLAKRLGYTVGDDRATGNPDHDDRMQWGDAD